VASGIGYVAAAYSVSRWLTKPTLRRPRQTPSDLGLAWEPLEARTADGLRLTGWLIEPPRPRATVALFHGARLTRDSILGRCVALVAAGYRCVAFDHRAHGESDGRRTSFGYHEAADVQAVRGLIAARWPGQPCAALGISMGAAALCYAARQTPTWNAVILEGLYHDIASAFQNRIGSRYPLWFRRFQPGVIWITERRLGIRLAELAPVEHIAHLAPAPVLLLTGSDDLHAPPEDARRLFERYPGPRQLWLVPGAAHRDVFEVGGAAYQERIVRFLDENSERGA
jgi:alpha-beta hydrolase superfamily lysophospholipase